MRHHEDTPRALTCRELTEFVMDYLDEALPAADRAAFEAHLVACEDCIIYLRSYRTAVELGKASRHPSADPAPGLPEALVQAILAARRKP